MLDNPQRARLHPTLLTLERDPDAVAPPARVPIHRPVPRHTVLVIDSYVRALLRVFAIATEYFNAVLVEPPITALGALERRLPELFGGEATTLSRRVLILGSGILDGIPEVLNLCDTRLLALSDVVARTTNSGEIPVAVVHRVAVFVMDLKRTEEFVTLPSAIGALVFLRVMGLPEHLPGKLAVSVFRASVVPCIVAVLGSSVAHVSRRIARRRPEDGRLAGALAIRQAYARTSPQNEVSKPRSGWPLLVV